ncbi:MAG: LysE family translocator [Pseudomonadota bacterium]
MSFEGWTVFALFWVVFVTSPGPNAVNCISNGMTLGFWRALPGVAAILTQAVLFLLISAAGITALIVASPEAFHVAQILGAAVLIGLGIRGWVMAARPVKLEDVDGRQVFWKAFAIATINPKSVAGYLAAFSQFVQPNVPIWDQMGLIVPTALTITALSYCTYTAIGAGIGQAALNAVFHIVVRRALAACFVIYGIALGGASVPGRV